MAHIEKARAGDAGFKSREITTTIGVSTSCITMVSEAQHLPVHNTPATFAGPRHERQVALLHALGPRPLFEFLADIARSTGQHALIADHIAEYASLDPEIVRAIGADRFPPNVLGMVR